jgi:hypothetical protein
MADTIKEFLVSIGFAVNDTQWKKFQNSVSGSTINVMGLGKAAIKTAAEVAFAVERIARQYEGLYYASQRTGASIEGLKAFGYAAQQIGLGAEQGRSSVEAFGAAMRNYPGLGEVLKQWSVTSIKPEEQIIQLTDSLKKKFGDKGVVGYANAASIAGMFGIPEPVFKSLWENIEITKKELQDYEDRLHAAGLNTEDLGGKSVELGREINRLGSDLGIFKDKIFKDFIDPMKTGVHWVDELVQKTNSARLTDDHGQPAGLWQRLRHVAAEEVRDAFIKGVEYTFKLSGQDDLAKKWAEKAQERYGGSEVQKPAVSAQSEGIAHGGAAIMDTLTLMGGGRQNGSRLSIASNAINLSDAQLKAIMRIEGGGRANARTGRYKGAYQLSDEEFAHYGSGSIWNAEDNRRAAIAKFTENSGEFTRKTGRQPTGIELYLMHQQGVGGLIAHEAHPNEPAWKNMASTAEGRRRGEGWAKKAIWGNVPDEQKSRFGSVKNLASGQFMDMWADKLARFTAAAEAGGSSHQYTQSNTITVHGAGTPQETADAVVAGLENLRWGQWRAGPRGDTIR